MVLANRNQPHVNRNQPHVKVADKIEQRNPGAGPKSGERVPYIIMDNGERLLCDRAEDPVYVIEKGLENKVDADYSSCSYKRIRSCFLFELIPCKKGWLW
jgi:DNA polymerase elongation subunit (family B)